MTALPAEKRIAGYLTIATDFLADNDRAVIKIVSARSVDKYHRLLTHLLRIYDRFKPSNDYDVIPGGIRVAVLDASEKQDLHFDPADFAKFAEMINVYCTAYLSWRDDPTEEGSLRVANAVTELGNDRDVGEITYLAENCFAECEISIGDDDNNTVSFSYTPNSETCSIDHTIIIVARRRSWTKIVTDKGIILVPKSPESAQLSVGDKIAPVGSHDAAKTFFLASWAVHAQQEQFDFAAPPYAE